MKRLVVALMLLGILVAASGCSLHDLLCLLLGYCP